MRVVQALHWLRDTIAVSDGRRQLAALLADPAQGQWLRDDLANGVSALPAWMQALLRPKLGAEASTPRTWPMTTFSAPTRPHAMGYS